MVALARRPPPLVPPMALLLLVVVRRSPLLPAASVAPVLAVLGVDHQVGLGEVSLGEERHLAAVLGLSHRHPTLLHAQPIPDHLLAFVAFSLALEPPESRKKSNLCQINSGGAMR